MPLPRLGVLVAVTAALASEHVGPIHGPPPVASKNGLVVSTDGLASDIGAAILRKGGNAVDAAVATAFALAVTHPAAGNIGGGGFMIAYDAPGHAILTIDFRELAPQEATPRMYLGPDGKLVPHHRAGARAA